ncbi:unnamed protein product [Paramecium pentaurelia]|uniref:Uncharacterized protein n=1 Tax=Paramecium pentaurelia TaxID=43138 RepID=A0A8S1VZV8_9CILI|nr:unnamed protein product [Paramecium pentaurelia]
MSEMKNTKRIYSSDGSLSIEQLKTICPDQYVTYEIFDLAFKQMWSVVNKLEMLQLQQNKNDKLYELEKRISNLEEVIHKLTNITSVIPESLQQQIIELTDTSKQILISIPQKIDQIQNDNNEKDERIKSVEDACNILARVLHDVQTEYEDQKDQIDKMESDLLNMFKNFQTVLKIEKDITNIQTEIQNITKAINEIYQFI